MGIHGLTLFVNNNQDMLMKSFYLHNTNLIIDGHSLCSQINKSLCGSTAFGGNYDKFASCTRNFFTDLRKCNVTPHIIFDGCHESKKLHTVLKRLLSKIRKAEALCPLTEDCIKIVPFLLRDVFRKVLSDMGIDYTICEFEADKNIALLARQMDCPVLTYDSDFFIYNVAYIPSYTLEWSPKLIEENDIETFAIECKMYRVQYLCDHFRGFDVNHLPLLATLLGNDYGDIEIFSDFFHHLKFCERQENESYKQRRMRSLFHWLQNNTLNTAIAKVLSRFRSDQRHKVFAIIKNNYEQYNYDASALKCNESMENNFIESSKDINQKMGFDILVNFSDDGFKQWSWGDGAAIICDNMKSIPSWFSEKIHQKKIPPAYLNLYAHHLQICNPQVEDFKQRDSFICSLSIVRLAFDILTDFSYENCYYISRAKDCCYKNVTIGKEHSIPRPFDESFETISDEHLKLCFMYFLHFKLQNLDLALIEMLPSNFQLFMISMLWWVSSCIVPEAHVHSLIMSYITLEVIDEKTGTARDHCLFNSKYAEILEEIRKNKRPYENSENELFLNKNNVKYEDCLIAASAFIKLFKIDESILQKPKTYDVKKIHSFAQFQCVLHEINSLNALCSTPYEPTVISRSYNGILIYNIALKLEKCTDPISFFDDYIKGATTILLLYKSIYSIFKQLSTKMRVSTVTCTYRPPRKHINVKRKYRWY